MDTTEKQRRFAMEYLVDGNARQAAVRAGYAESSAHVTGSRLLKDERVQKVLAQEQSRRAERLQVSADDVERRLWEIANENRSDRVPALALLAKRYNYGREVPREGAKHLHLHNVSDQTLLALAERLGPPPR